MHKLNQWIGLLLLVLATGFALWLYRIEPTARIDPNDNAFQYALIDRTNTIWDYAAKVCPKTITYPVCHFSYLIDHWVPNWAEGYNLPYYYSHIPQITIVASYRLLQMVHIIPLSFSLFQYYHVAIFLLLCSLPVVTFVAFRILSLPWFTAGVAAWCSILISTDGLYGIDQTSFLWRGWGLSSQLFALIWLPLALASVVRYAMRPAKKPVHALVPILLLTGTTAGHLGIGMMAWMATAVICCTPILIKLLDKESLRSVLRQIPVSLNDMVRLLLPALLLLSYWIIPVFLNGEYHNTSFWDPLWKFHSFGVIEVVTKLLGGALFDFGRLPIMTVLVCFGCVLAWTKRDTESRTVLPIGVLFLFFFAMFFGRTTWGTLIDFIPGMSDFHGHRFIVGVHLAGIFLAPIAITWVIKHGSMWIQKILKVRHTALITFATASTTLIIIGWMMLPHIIDYATYNNTLIRQGNAAYEEAKPDFDRLVATLKTREETNPGRIYALRATEGSAFKIASSPYFMALSTVGFPTVLWLPETWSANSDTEQFFTEENPNHYTLYNIRYVVAPPSKTPQPFWTMVQQTPHWVLYEVSTSGYIAPAYTPSVVGSSKTNFINLIHFWIQSKNPEFAVYPELQITNRFPSNRTLPYFRMQDEATYQTPDGMRQSLMAEPPTYSAAASLPPPPMRVQTQTVVQDMRYTARVTVTAACPTCTVVLRQTYHPNWTVTVNGTPAHTINVFPSFVAVQLTEPGTYDVTFTYRPAPIKILLLFIGLTTLSVFLFKRRTV